MHLLWDSDGEAALSYLPCVQVSAQGGIFQVATISVSFPTMSHNSSRIESAHYQVQAVCYGDKLEVGNHYSCVRPFKMNKSNDHV